MDQQTTLEFVKARISDLHRQAAHERLAAQARRLTMRTDGLDRPTGSGSHGRLPSSGAPMRPAVSRSR
jgi:hypothetical protein